MRTIFLLGGGPTDRGAKSGLTVTPAAETVMASSIIHTEPAHVAG